MQKPKSQKKKKKSDSNASNKVLLSDFKSKRLALFAKRCARAATCTVHLCPDDSLFCWPMFTEEVERMADAGRGEALIEALAELQEEPDGRDRLLRFVSDPRSFQI